MIFNKFYLEKGSTVPADQIRIGIQPEAKFQVIVEPVSGADQEPEGKVFSSNHKDSFKRPTDS